jgi:hypothetical protein
MSDQTACRKTYKEKLTPTPTQERELERVLWHCRTLYNTALEQRITAWERCHASLTRYQQEAELKARRSVRSSRTTPPSTATSCRMSWLGWTRHSRRSSGG